MSDYAPETGPDGRQRPRYGEYATPDEQRARIQQPDVTWALETGTAPDAAATPGAQGAAGAASVVPGAATDTTAPVVPPRDRIVTLLLLAVGAANVLVSAFSYLDIAPAIQQSMTLMGVPGEFTNFEAARTWGIVATIALVVGYALTLLASVRRMRKGKLSWWIPLVGAVVTFVVVSTCLSVPITSDPAFIDYLRSLS